MRKMLFVLGMAISVFIQAQCWTDVGAGFGHTMAIKSDSTLWVWGANYIGQLGLGDTTPRKNPVQMTSNTKWISLSVGFNYSSAISLNGSLWTWGLNRFYQLGDGTSIDKKAPIKIGNATDWSLVSIQNTEHTLAIKNNNTLWAWGSNYNGCLGDGTTIDRKTPIQIDGSTDWKIVCTGGNFSTGIKLDSTLWVWGDNSKGQLGNGTYINSYNPIKIDSISRWRTVYAGYDFCLAIKVDGTLWAWGNNYDGELGDGTTIGRKTPIQIGVDTNWQSISAGWTHTVAIRTDGTLWAWGDNSSAQLGDGTIINKKIPIKIGIGTNWKLISAGVGHTVAIKNDGSLWGWGNNYYGQLGDGTNVYKATPIQIICQPLPLKLLSFNAKLQTQNSVALNWQTVNEVNVSHINIQRSNNGKDFTSIGKVNASCCSYEFKDGQLSTVDGQLFYRLEMVDKDGSKTYSTIQQITIKPQTPNIAIFPNPPKDFVTIECAGAKELLIIDNLGRTIKQFNNPTERQTLNTKQLTKGIYVVKAILTNGDIKTEKLVVE